MLFLPDPNYFLLSLSRIPCTGPATYPMRRSEQRGWSQDSASSATSGGEARAVRLAAGSASSAGGSRIREQQSWQRGGGMCGRRPCFSSRAAGRHERVGPSHRTTSYPSNQTKHWLSPTTSKPSNQTEKIGPIRDIPIPRIISSEPNNPLVYMQIKLDQKCKIGVIPINECGVADAATKYLIYNVHKMHRRNLKFQTGKKYHNVKLY
jgi:hypothetical protein